MNQARIGHLVATSGHGLDRKLNRLILHPSFFTGSVWAGGGSPIEKVSLVEITLSPSTINYQSLAM
jgi:hypothetical protein